MRNNRLLVSGCSFTEYCWSTWADILSSQFIDYKNVGCSGADNASIARFIINESKSSDTVVILWSSFDRWSMYHPDMTYWAKHDPNNHWYHHGSLVNNKDFFTNYYNPVERFQTTMDYVQLIDLHSKAHGYNAWHFPAFPWLLGECEKNIDPEVQKIFDQTNIRNNYLTSLSLAEMRIQKKQDFFVNHKYTEGDTHPTPITQLNYVQEIIAPKLGIDLTGVDFSSIMLEQQDVLNGKVK